MSNMFNAYCAVAIQLLVVVLHLAHARLSAYMKDIYAISSFLVPRHDMQEV